MIYDEKKYADFYEHDAAIGADNRLAETQYGLKGAEIFSPSVYYTNYKKQLGLVAGWADQSGATILDIGCGDGEFRQQLKKMKEYVGLDVSRSRIDYCEKKFSDKKSVFYEGDFLNYDFAGKRFGMIVASEIIEHVPDVDQFMKKAKRLLEPGGTIIISTPLGDEYSEFSGQLYKQQHLRVYDMTSVKKLLSQHNFSILKIRSVGFRLKIKLGRFNKKIIGIFKEQKFKQEAFFEFSLQYNSFFDKFYFKLGRLKFLWVMLFNIINFFSMIFPEKGNQVVIMATSKKEI